MNRSFWNKDVSVRGKMLFGAMVVMLSAMLLFVVCGGGDKEKNPVTPPSCTGGQILVGGACQCPTGQVWNGSACQVAEPGNTCPGGQIMSGGVCVCPSGQTWNGSACVATPTCTPPQILQNGVCVDPTPNCTGGQILVGNTCQCPTGQTWNGSACVTDSGNNCTGGMVMVGGTCQCPTGQQWNDAMGMCIAGCPPGQVIVGGVCVTDCPAGQIWNGTACVPTGTGPTGSFCRWDADPDNCWPIGGPHSDENTATEATCRAAYGEVVTDCNAASTMQYCLWGEGECWPMGDPNAMNADNPTMTNLQNCQEYSFGISSSPTCAGLTVPTEQHFCRWDTGCSRITNPSALDPDNPGMTNLQVCQEYGYHFTTEAACLAFTPPVAGDWCYWDGTGCSQIRNPEAIDPNNPGMTNRAVCQAYGLGYFTTQAACQAFTPPAVIYYCDWGTGGCWNMGAGTQACDGGGSACTGTQMDHCRANGAVVQCSGTDRPSNGSCCVGSRQ